ncbi:MAG: Gfo/Idh/MocA family oxidoreductase [Candidatus Hydrogenedentes bacterium]|nr:Gfo/Idh/MocA family oxidoreductase [Candidatus Hydrogenedentota bacterium]
MIHDTLTRRAFLAATTTTALLAATTARANDARVVPRKLSPNEKLNVAAIGVGGQGLTDIMNCRKENVVALCDVDWKRAEEAFYRLPDARRFIDFREMLEAMPEIDAVTISTPDFMHAPATYTAMKLGKHVYVQKPLAHTPMEARLLARTAAETGVVTQMGNQGHSSAGARRFCEILWSGEIGEVREAHAWTDRPGRRWHRDPAALESGEPVPEQLDWDLWLGCGPRRPYSEILHPNKWRVWWDYGCGALGDMACHVLDAPYWALKLGEAAAFTVEPVLAEGGSDVQTPAACVLKFSFPERAGMPPVDLYWHDGGKLPQRPPGVPNGERLGDKDGGSFLIGTAGVLGTGTYGTTTSLLPAARMERYTLPPEILPRVSGSHYRNWIEACKGGDPACSSFDYAAPFTEMILVGNIALRVGEKVKYDFANGAVLNNPAAQALLSKEYQNGWTLPVDP